jgi:hypothetical protein
VKEHTKHHPLARQQTETEGNKQQENKKLPEQHLGQSNSRKITPLTNAEAHKTQQHHKETNPHLSFETITRVPTPLIK